MTEHEATRALADERALWELGGGGGAAEVIAAAVDALVEGIDSTSLRELAGRSGKEPHSALAPLMGATLEELNLTYPDSGSDEIQVGAARAMARRLLDGRLNARQFVSWAHAAIGHEGADQLQDIVILDDEYDDRASTGLAFTLEAFEAIVRDAAENLLASDNSLE